MLDLATLRRLSTHAQQYPGVSEVTLPVEVMTELAFIALRAKQAQADADTRALALAEKIMQTYEVTYLGGDVQHKAVIQTMIVEALSQQ